MELKCRLHLNIYCDVKSKYFGHYLKQSSTNLSFTFSLKFDKTTLCLYEHAHILKYTALDGIM